MRGPMQQMQRRVSGFSRNTQRSLGGVSRGFRTLRRVAGLAVAAMTTGAVARAVTDFASAGDEVAKMARELGIGAEALQELRFAADRQGVSSDDLEKSLGALNNRVGQLRNNQGSLATMLNRSNPALAEQLRNAEDTDEAFTLMMEALHGTENAADRAALAQAAFGRSGQALVRMAEVGSSGIQDLRDEARRLGLVMSEEATANAELFQDSLTNLKGSMRGVINGALVPMIERLQPIIAQMAEWVAANQDLINQRIEQVFQGIADAARLIARAWDSVVLPAILAGVVAFKAITTGIAAYQSVLAIAKAAQIAFNVVLTANPIGLIIVAIAALIGVIVLMVRHWDTVTATLRRAWDWFSALLDNPLIAAAALVFAPFIAIPAMIVKHWGVLKDFFVGVAETVMAIWDRVVGAVMASVEAVRGAIDRVRDIGGGIRDRIGNVFDGDRSTGLFTRSTAGIQQTSRTETSRSEVDIRLGNLPAGSSVRQTGRAPGVSLNYGAAGGRLR
jgi:hypothetical protein